MIYLLKVFVHFNQNQQSVNNNHNSICFKYKSNSNCMHSLNVILRVVLIINKNQLKINSNCAQKNLKSSSK